MYKVSTQRGPCITLTLYTGFLVPYYYYYYHYFNRVALSLACLLCNSGCHDFKSLGALCCWTGIQFADLINWYDVLMEWRKDEIIKALLVSYCWKRCFLCFLPYSLSLPPPPPPSFLSLARESDLCRTGGVVSQQTQTCREATLRTAL